MEIGIGKALGIKPGEVRMLIRARGDGLAGEIESMDEKPVWAKRLRKEWIEYGRRVERLRGWAGGDPACLQFLEKATLFELTVTMEQNATYPCLGGFRGVTLEHVLKLSREIEFPVTREQLGYAVAVRAVLERKSIGWVELQEECRREGIVDDGSGFDPVNTFPFPPEIMAEHPLAHIDPEDATPGDLAGYGGDIRGTPVDLVRERRHMSNRLERVGDTVRLREGAQEFIRLIKRLL